MTTESQLFEQFVFDTNRSPAYMKAKLDRTLGIYKESQKADFKEWKINKGLMVERGTPTRKSGSRGVVGNYRDNLNELINDGATKYFVENNIPDTPENRRKFKSLVRRDRDAMTPVQNFLYDNVDSKQKPRLRKLCRMPTYCDNPNMPRYFF